MIEDGIGKYEQDVNSTKKVRWNRESRIRIGRGKVDRPILYKIGKIWVKESRLK